MNLPDFLKGYECIVVKKEGPMTFVRGEKGFSPLKRAENLYEIIS